MGDWFHWLAQIIGSKGVHGVTPDKVFAGQLETGVGAMEEENQKGEKMLIFHCLVEFMKLNLKFYAHLQACFTLYAPDLCQSPILSGANLGQTH